MLGRCFQQVGHDFSTDSQYPIYVSIFANESFAFDNKQSTVTLPT